MTAKADLHVHSKHSNRPSEWLLRQLAAPESFTEPLAIYRRARERGMDFVTVSDHDSVAGALEIAHLPGTFLSSEVTAAFPEDGCQIHCLVLGVSEAQHAEVQRLRGNLYELRDYLRREDVVCSVAHPLFRVNGRLTLQHLEKLLVLFPRFEAPNGIHDRLQNDLARRLLSALDREVIADLAERHRLEPWGPTPWIKHLTGGSDDHGGHYIATTWTETPRAATVAEFLGHLRAGAHEPAGETGSSLRLTQSLYSIAYEWYRQRFEPLLGQRRDPFARLLRSLAEGPKPRRSFAFLPALRRAPETPDRATFGFASRASRSALLDLLRGAVRHGRRGRLPEALGSLAHLAPLALAAAPYLVALEAQHRDQDLLEQVAARFLPPGSRVLPDKRAWFVESLDGAPALAERVRRLPRLPRNIPRRLARWTPDPAPDIVTCDPGPAAGALAGLAVRVFQPVATLPLPGTDPSVGPEAGPAEVILPPLLEILEHCERERYAEIVVSSPGPLGLAGLLAARLLGVRATGLYLVDPASAAQQILSDDGSGDGPAGLVRGYLRWFYGRLDTVYADGPAHLEQLAGLDVGPARLRLLPHAGEAAPSPLPEVPAAAGREEEPALAGCAV